MSQMKDTDDKAIQEAGRRLRETYVPMLASIGPRNVASLLVREAVMVSDDADDDAVRSIRDGQSLRSPNAIARPNSTARGRWSLESHRNERPADFQSSSRGQPRWLLQHRSSRRRHRRILCRAL